MVLDTATVAAPRTCYFCLSVGLSPSQDHTTGNCPKAVAKYGGSEWRTVLYSAARQLVAEEKAEREDSVTSAAGARA